jgi:hypothetical protein
MLRNYVPAAIKYRIGSAPTLYQNIIVYAITTHNIQGNTGILLYYP